MRTKPRKAAVGAVATAALLLAATACSSESNDPVAEPSADTTVETTVGGAEAAPVTDAPDETAAPTGDIDDTAPAAGDSTPADPDVVVPEALQFTAPLVGGGTFDGAALADKPTVFWFWAPT